MRLKEERIVIVLAVFGVLLILITAFIQIADSKIHDYESEIQKKNALLTNHLLIRESYLSSTLYQAVLLLWGQHNNKPDLEDAVKNYNSSKSTYESFLPVNKKEASELNGLVEAGTAWTLIKRALFVIQFALIILSLGGYLYILSGIHKRIKRM